MSSLTLSYYKNKKTPAGRGGAAETSLPLLEYVIYSYSKMNTLYGFST